MPGKNQQIKPAGPAKPSSARENTADIPQKMIADGEAEAEALGNATIRNKYNSSTSE